jgi:hypothetical protein
VKVTGTIKTVEWKNPHVWFYVDVKDESGKMTTWGFSTSPPGMLLRRGITKDVFKMAQSLTSKAPGLGTDQTTPQAEVTFADGGTLSPLKQ